MACQRSRRAAFRCVHASRKLRPSAAPIKIRVAVCPFLALAHGRRQAPDIIGGILERDERAAAGQGIGSSNARFQPRSGMASTSMPPIIPRQRFGADRRDLLRVGDILIGQARANPRPCLPEFQFAVVEVGAVVRVPCSRSRSFRRDGTPTQFSS